jgi:imidazolonepropionase-like amidohydrolase
MMPRLYGLFFLLSALGLGQEQKVIQAEAIHLADGSVIAPGAVVIEGDKILAVGPELPVPDGAEVIQARGHLTAGLIDAAATVGMVPPEHASEVIPQLRNIDAIDLEDKAFQRLAAQGVTTVYVTPDPAAVIGCRGAVVKTAGPADRRVVRAEAAVKANIGPEGWRRGARNRGPRGAVTFLTRRPTTRMGSTWVFRRAFHDALLYREAKGKGDAALDTLVKVLDGEIPLRMQAREDIDIWSAIRLAGEFGLPIVIEEGTEAYRCIPELKACGAPVIFGPVFIDATGSRTRSGEYLRPCLNTAGLLDQAGITVALTAGDRTGEGALPHQAGYAIRAGLPFEKALKATTITPARLLGLDDRMGDVKPGHDADLVLWTGKPFSPAAKPALVLISGRVVYRDESWMGEK